MFFRLLFVLFLTTFVLSAARAQTPVVMRDPNAVALAGQALKALAGVTPLSDITLQATAAYVAGSDEESGTATLVARGNNESLSTLNLSGGTTQEVRNGVAGVRTGPDGNAHAMATHNCFIDANWFFPALSMAALSADPTLAISYVGPETHLGQAVYHLVLYHVLSGQTPDVVAVVLRVSAMDLYLDATSLAPVAMDFNLHPDNAANIDVPAEIRFGGYQSFSGVQAPTRIQKYIQNSLVLDLTVTNVTVNSGVPASTFTLPYVSSGGVQ
jgi:hypothetical protein